MTHKKFTRHVLPHVHEDGSHRRATAITLPALLVYLVTLTVLSAGLYVIRISAPHILGIATFGAREIVDLTNTKRAEYNLSPLSANEQLTAAAAAKAGDMFSRDYWAHNSPGGRTPWSFITESGFRYIFAGENLARDFTDAKSAVDAWMRSPSHRSNLLDSNFREIGVAVENGKLTGREGTLVVQMFGTQVSEAPTSGLAQGPAPVAEVQSSPSPLAPAASPQAAVAQVKPAEFTAGLSEATVLASRRFAVAKFVSLALVGLIFVLFALEAVLTVKRSHLELRAGILAHLLILGFVLLTVWYAVAGAIV